MKTVLVIGASGFVGRHLTKALVAKGYAIRCLARNPAKLADLAAAGCEIVQGDIADLSSVQRATASAEAVYIAIHTLSPQQTGAARARFMEIEKNGVQNVITACWSSGARRVVYLTSLGVSATEKSEWLRERWNAEQLLLGSGLDATVIQPGYIVGVGGRGFETVVSNAGRRVAVTFGGDSPKMRTIAVDDLAYYMVGVLEDPRTYGQCYEVGNDEILSINQLIDITAETLGHGRPIKVQMPLALLGAFAPLIGRLGKLPGGAMKGMVDSLSVDMSGNPMPIRHILPQPLLTFRQALERALSRSESIR